MENAIKELTVSIQNLSSQMQSDSGYISIILSLFAIGISIYWVTIMNKHDFLFLIWKNPQSRRNYIVGKLSRLEKGYTFEYSNEYTLAKDAGWDMVTSFPEVKKYESNELFPAFSSRLPDRKRRNIEEVLQKYGLEEYDGYELLRRSGGRLPIDTYEFVDPNDITYQ